MKICGAENVSILYGQAERNFNWWVINGNPVPFALNPVPFSKGFTELIQAHDAAWYEHQ